MTPVQRDRWLTAAVGLAVVVFGAAVTWLFVAIGAGTVYAVLLGATALCVIRLGWWLHTWSERQGGGR